MAAKIVHMLCHKRMCAKTQRYGHKLYWKPTTENRKFFSMSTNKGTGVFPSDASLYYPNIPFRLNVFCSELNSSPSGKLTNSKFVAHYIWSESFLHCRQLSRAREKSAVVPILIQSCENRCTWHQLWIMSQKRRHLGHQWSQKAKKQMQKLLFENFFDLSNSGALPCSSLQFDFENYLAPFLNAGVTASKKIFNK